MVAADAPRAARLIKVGDYWSVEYDGLAVLIEDGKGIRDLAVLLPSPGREVHAVELASRDARTGADPSRVASLRALGDESLVAPGDGVGERLDAAARRAYRARLAELRALPVAEEQGAGVREEIAFLERELRTAEGLGGRVRPSRSAQERARKTVGSRMRHAFAKIGREHPALGAHLERSLVIGVFCCYAPADPVDWIVET